jgi:hypothetical protein
MRLLNGGALKILITLSLVFAGACIYAQSNQESKPFLPDVGARNYGAAFNCADVLKRLDTDRDGYLTRNEWERFFDDHDTNADGRLSQDEVQPNSRREENEEALRPDQGRLMAFERLDANKNDAIESSEWPGREEAFRNMDANHDGSLSREEFLSRNGRYWNEKFENLDFNGDKLITRSEWLDSDLSFDRLDRDHNGVVERHEYYNPR